jgi:hypothetical protein
VHIRVYQHRGAAFEEVFFGLYLEAFEASVAEHTLFGHFGGHVHGLFGLDDLGRRVYVVEQRIVVGEAFGRKELLGIQSTIRLAELRVALVG